MLFKKFANIDADIEVQDREILINLSKQWEF